MAARLAPASARERLIVGLDVANVEAARAMVDRLDDGVDFYKVGMRLVYAGGLDFAAELAASGKKVFLDLKLLDIDNTVREGVESLAPRGFTFLTIHAYPKAMAAAVAGRGGDLGLLGVSVLTSMDDGDLAEAGYGEGVETLVARRARQARQTGMDGLVCAPGEAAAMRGIVGDDMVLVTPGIRPAGAGRGDQKRVMTPAEAIGAGADYLVVARPVIGADDPRAAAEAIVAEIETALGAQNAAG